METTPPGHGHTHRISQTTPWGHHCTHWCPQGCHKELPGHCHWHRESPGPRNGHCHAKEVTIPDTCSDSSTDTHTPTPWHGHRQPCKEINSAFWVWQRDTPDCNLPGLCSHPMISITNNVPQSKKKNVTQSTIQSFTVCFHFFFQRNYVSTISSMSVQWYSGTVQSLGKKTLSERFRNSNC